MRLIIAALVLLAGLGGGWSAPAMATATAAPASHMSSACHEQTPATDHHRGPADPAVAPHLCIGCAVIEQRAGGLPAPALIAAAVHSPSATGPLPGRRVGPDTPPPRPFA